MQVVVRPFALPSAYTWLFMPGLRLNVTIVAFGASLSRATQLSALIRPPDPRSSRTRGGATLEVSRAVTLMASRFQLSDVQPKHGPCASLITNVAKPVSDVCAGTVKKIETALPRLQPGAGGELGVLRAVDRLTDVAHAHRRAVAVGDDDVVPRRRRQQLVVVVDRQVALVAVEAALGGIDAGRG